MSRLHDDPLVGHDQQPTTRTAAEVEQRQLRTQAGYLAPGAVLLLAFQILAVEAGALDRLLVPEQVALVASGLSVALSILLLLVVIRRRALPAAADQQGRGVDQVKAIFLAGVGALAGALGADVFVATTRLTGSSGLGGLLGAAVLLAVSVPWL
jgi:hypothetical protein